MSCLKLKSLVLCDRWGDYWDDIDIEMILILCVGVTVNGWLLYVLVVAGGQSVMASPCQKTAHRLFLFFFGNFSFFLFLPGCQIHNNANFPFLFLEPACFIFFHWLSPDLFSLFYIWLCQSIKSQSIINIRLMAPSISSSTLWQNVCFEIQIYFWFSDIQTLFCSHGACVSWSGANQSESCVFFHQTRRESFNHLFQFSQNKYLYFSQNQIQI